jgi:hypothetical protein
MGSPSKPLRWAGPTERRVYPDRRARPTALRSALRIRGRRRGFRRAGEGRNAYVDCPAPRSVLLVGLVLMGSLFDAYMTLVHIQYGGSEANPFMALALALGPTVFVGIKMGLTGAGAWFLAAHQYFPLAYKGLHGLVLGYGMLLVYHLMLALGHL